MNLIFLLVKEEYNDALISTTFFLFAILIFNIIIKTKAKIIYKKNFIDKNLINIHNEVFINEKEVILKADNGNKNITILNEIIEIYETSNLLVLKNNNKSAGGCIINKEKLKNGTLNELKQHLLFNCKNLKKKKIIPIKKKSPIVKIFCILLVVTIIICFSLEMILSTFNENQTILTITDRKYDMIDVRDFDYDENGEIINPSEKYYLLKSDIYDEIVNDVQKYKILESEKLIILIGKRPYHQEEGFKYFVLNYESDICNYYDNIEDIIEIDKNIIEQYDWLIPHHNS